MILRHWMTLVLILCWMNINVVEGGWGSVELHKFCEITSQCTQGNGGDNAFCVFENRAGIDPKNNNPIIGGTCRCGLGYHDEPSGSDDNARCKPSGTCNEDSECTNPIVPVCLKRYGFCGIKKDDNPIPPGLLGSKCSKEGVACGCDKNSVCTADWICKCRSGYSIIGGSCVKDNAVNGICNPDNNKKDCQEDNNAECMGDIGSVGICMCKQGFTASNGVCVRDGELGGVCKTGVDDSCPGDKFSICKDNWCKCRPGYRAIGGQCIQDNRLLGKCDGMLGDICNLDKNAECRDGMCMCLPNTSARNGMCVPDETLLGRCRGNFQTPCVRGDKNTICVNGYCQCKLGTKPKGNHCIVGGTLFGTCDSNVDCDKDKFTQCINGWCRCMLGSRNSGGMCVQDETSGGFCNLNPASQECAGDSNSNCVNEKCECKNGHSNVGGICVKEGSPGGMCVGALCQEDPRSVCEDGMCTCSNKTTMIGGLCIRDGCIDGACCENSKCKGAGVTCDVLTNMCVCNKGYTRGRGGCKRFKNKG